MHRGFNRIASLAFFPSVIIFLVLKPVPAEGQLGEGELCTSYQEIHLEQYFLHIPADSMLYGTVPTFGDNNCETENGSRKVDPGGWAYARTLEEAEALCHYGAERLIRHPDLSKATHNLNLWRCGSPPVREGSESSTWKPKPWVPTGITMMSASAIYLAAVDGLDSGIHFQRVGAEGIGIQWVLDLGWLDGVDVWGEIGAGYQVCFPQLGRIVFLDAATAPRSVITDVAYEFVGGYTCAIMDRAGTLVLVADPENVPPEGEPMALLDCVVSNDHSMYLRDAPNGTVMMRTVPAEMSFDTWSRTPGWFAVRYGEVYGWANTMFLAIDEACHYAPAE